MVNTTAIAITPGRLSLGDLRRIWQSPVQLRVDEGSRKAIDASAAAVQRIVERGEAAYGINTGFGLLSKTRIPNDQLRQLQQNLIYSHSVGIGDLLSDQVVRLALAMKIGSLARGYSGVRSMLIDTLIALNNAGIVPCIPSKGSVGASGDLAPLAHLTLALMGEGAVLVKGERVSARQALAAAGIAPVQLGPKEGLALINGTQISTALALHGWFQTERLLEAAIVVGALSVDAAKGSDAPFDPRLHELRGQRGQIATARIYRELLAHSEIRASHLVHDDRVQDPYSLRCQPQVMGACRDLLMQAADTLLIESNAVTDNPLIFAEQNEAISGGNFHAEPVALAADTLALAIAEIGALSERRIALLIDATLSGLPPFLVPEPGVNSGFMVAHVTAAAAASENKSFAHPASVDSLPTSANQEDHVSMATFAARRLHDMAMNTATIIGIELLAAAQGIDFHRPLKTSPMLQRVHRAIRDKVTFYAVDRVLAPDIDTAMSFVLQGTLSQLCAETLRRED